MEEYEELIRKRFRDQKLPRNIVTDFIRKLKEKGHLLDDEMTEIPQNVTMDELKKKLMECRRFLFSTSLDSFHRDVEVEEIAPSRCQNEKENKLNYKMSNNLENNFVNKEINMNKEYDTRDRANLNECQNNKLPGKKHILNNQTVSLTKRNRETCQFDKTHSETALEKKERRLRNVLRAYYEYEITKIKEEQNKPISTSTYTRKTVTFLIIVVISLLIIILIDTSNILKPY